MHFFYSINTIFVFFNKKFRKTQSIFCRRRIFFHDKERISIVYPQYQPIENYNTTLFFISGITGINHNIEKDIIEQPFNNKNRVVIIHPRGTGYSEGKHGDISDFSEFITDYIEIIKRDKDYNSKRHKTVLFGHTMSTAVLLAVADKLDDTGGAIHVNHPFILKKVRSMSPGFGEYVKYGWFSFFQEYKPIVNMAGETRQELKTN